MRHIPLLLLAFTIGFLLAVFALAVGIVEAKTEVCFCHNVNHNPHTICTDNEGLINGHLGHTNNGEDTLGACQLSPTPTFSPTPTRTPKNWCDKDENPSITLSPTASLSPSPTPTPTDVPTSPSVSPVESPSPTVTVTSTPSPTTAPTAPSTTSVNTEIVVFPGETVERRGVMK